MVHFQVRELLVITRGLNLHQIPWNHHFPMVSYGFRWSFPMVVSPPASLSYSQPPNGIPWDCTKPQQPRGPGTGQFEPGLTQRLPRTEIWWWISCDKENDGKMMGNFRVDKDNDWTRMVNFRVDLKIMWENSAKSIGNYGICRSLWGDVVEDFINHARFFGTPQNCHFDWAHVFSHWFRGCPILSDKAKWICQSADTEPWRPWVCRLTAFGPCEVPRNLKYIMLW